MKNILLTYDYEVFFVKFGTIDNSLLIPTSELVKEMDRHSMKGTFFVDVLFLDYLRRQGDNAAYDRIINQLKWVLSCGHRIELHIHPHWLDTDKGIVDFKRYRLQTFSEEEQSSIFAKGLEILYSIAKSEDANYKVLAYRAGGWCVQPFSELYNTFKEYDIRIDSSVASGMYQKSSSHFFDFRNAPNKEYYNFSKEITVEKTDGEFVEIPITTFKTNPINKLYKRWIAKTNKKQITSYGDGHGMTVSKFVLLRKLFERRAMFSIDGVFDLEHMFELMKKSELDTITFISHPKNLTNFSLEYLKKIDEECLNCISMRDYYFQYIFTN
ncbi:hypothetical protein I6E26_01895 [Anaerovibrio lipolyticus]|uniref:hypothetical protein n=1 Tax=Anaerovibrio lipolyticus TaxID=82374 RepID=UPI001F2ECB0B|nr:hypothetical protein [Anaerovibrio lipolyticus]MCF2600312.1 hypothetical protein [Anaerovibrio lipolyticus]